VISIPAYVGQQRSAARTEAYSNLQNLRLLEEQFFAENACYRPLAGGACPAGPTNYVGTANIQGFLPGFRPGAGTNFDYAIIAQSGFSLPNPPNPVPVPYDFSTAPLADPNTPCFIATATGLPGTRVDGDIFTIDCNNNRNF
jgi:hypothetical protein